MKHASAREIRRFNTKIKIWLGFMDIRIAPGKKQLSKIGVKTKVS
jgi:hypothetical protein